MIDDTLPPLRTPAAAARPERPAIIRAWRAPASPAEARGIAVRKAGFLPGMAGAAGFMRPRTGGNDSYTKLLLHCDGANGSMSFPDASGSAHTVTANGNAQVSTAQSKFGGASAAFDGSGDYLSIPDSNDWDFGSGDFTIDCWVRVTTVTSKRHAIAIKASSAVVTSWALYIVNNQFEFNASTNDSTWNVINALLFGSISTNTWYHVAVTRSGDTWRFFQDGVQQTSTTASGALSANANVVQIGGNGFVDHYLSGWIDEMRISKGVARWTSNFTPPMGPYS
jgi:hypothetical protein